jgi:hypothetical protein
VDQIVTRPPFTFQESDKSMEKTETAHGHHNKQPLYQRLGAVLGPQADKKLFLAVTRAYCDAIERGDIEMPEQIAELPLGHGKFVRMFVIQE